MKKNEIDEYPQHFGRQIDFEKEIILIKPKTELEIDSKLIIMENIDLEKNKNDDFSQRIFDLNIQNESKIIIEKIKNQTQSPKINQKEERSKSETKSKKSSLYSRVSMSLKRGSNIINSMIDAKTENGKKIHIAIKNFFLPHSIAISVTVFLILIQDKINASCFVGKNCLCYNNFWIKLLTYIKSFFLFWILIIILMLSLMTITKEIYAQFWIKYLVGIWVTFVTAIVYLSEDGEQSAPPYINSILYLYIGSLFFFIFFFLKLKLSVKLICQKWGYQILFLSIICLNRMVVKTGFDALTDYFTGIYYENATQYFSIIIFFYLIIFENITVLLLYKIYDILIREEFPGLGPIIVLIRVLICYIISSQVSNLLSKDFFFEFQFTDYLLFLYHITFVFTFYLSFNPVMSLLELIVKKITNKFDFVFEKTENMLIVDKLFSGYMLDFQMILIPKLIILMSFNKWINIHNGIFYSDCQMTISNKFLINSSTSIILIILNLIFPVIFFIWMRYKNTILFSYKVEEYGLVYRIFVIVSFHCYLERIMQDIRFINEKKTNDV